MSINNTRRVRRWESWPVCGAMQYESGWRYYQQVQMPRFFFFGALVWRDAAGPFQSEEQMDSIVHPKPTPEMEILS